MAFLTRSRLAVLCALPAVLVPGIELPLMLWARHSFLALHPDYMDDPPTISRAINDPVVGVPFADLILVIAALVATVIPILAWAYLLAIAGAQAGPGRRMVMHGLLALMLLCQLAASGGMVLTTQYTFDTSDRLHMLGSYIFFFFQAFTVLFGASLCRMLLRQKEFHAIPDAAWQFRPAMHRYRFRFALLIVAIAVFYGILFIAKDHELPVSKYAVQVVYTQTEVVVIGCFVLFLGTYAVDIYHMVREDKLRLPAKAPDRVME